MQGADVAFYRSRSRYHTMDDSIRGMGYEGARRALWTLMELLRFVGDNILNAKTASRPGDETESAVYFERRYPFNRSNSGWSSFMPLVQCLASISSPFGTTLW